MDQAARQRRCQKRADVAATCRSAEQKNLAWVAAECRDIGVEPAQHRDLVQASVIARDFLWSFGVQRGMRQKAENAKPQIVADEYNTLRDEPLATISEPAEPGRALPRQRMIAAAG